MEPSSKVKESILSLQQVETLQKTYRDNLEICNTGVALSKIAAQSFFEYHLRDRVLGGV